MDKTLDVYWCEEHRFTGVGQTCPCGANKVIGFVTYTNTEEANG